MNSEFLANTTDDLPHISDQLWELFTSKVICFTGDLGAGKTTLIKSLLLSKHHTENTSSPSYSLINEYILGESRVYHMDLYRLNDIQEAIDIGILEYLDSGEWVFIEWPQIIESLLPENFHQIKIEILADTNRKIILI